MSDFDAKGTQCSCGKFTEFPGYVYAHWDIPLTFTCACGQTFHIREGVSKPVKTKAPKAT